MPTVTHPRIPTLTREVTDAEMPRWLAQGWLSDATPDPPPANPGDGDPDPQSDPATAPESRQPRGRRSKKEN